jgi:hypothetical protein
MDVEREILAFGSDGPSSVDSHSDTHVDSVRPDRCRKRALTGPRSLDGLGSGSEHRGNFVPKSPVNDAT